MTILYIVFGLMCLLTVFFVTYRLRGLKIALGISAIALFSLWFFYVVLVMLVTSQM
jgi:hypothetical protein